MKQVILVVSTLVAFSSICIAQTNQRDSTAKSNTKMNNGNSNQNVNNSSKDLKNSDMNNGNMNNTRNKRIYNDSTSKGKK